MANFYVKTGDMDQMASICELMRKIEMINYNDILNVHKQLSYNISARGNLDKRILTAAANCKVHAMLLAEFKVLLDGAADVYHNAELRIINQQKSNRRHAGHIDSVVFDEEGGYGGNQGAPQMATGKEREELRDIVRKYYPNMTDKEIADYLKKLNSEGCGFVAVINTIFAAFEGKEDEFEKKFGFPMYENGELNYNKLLVDYYAATDNHKMDDMGNDYIDFKEDASATDGWGTTQYDREYQAEKYLLEKGINVEIITDCPVTPDNFNDLSKDGYVMIAYENGNLQNEDGSIAKYINGGHAMIVTGVTEDGRYIVSSWGKKYYIDPNEIVQKDGNTTSFTYSYYKY